MNRLLPILILAAMAVALLGAAGCGDDGDSSGSEPLSKEELIAEADQVCAEGDAEIDAAGQAFAGSTDRVDELVRTVIAPGLREQIEQLRELTPPAGDQPAFDEFVDTFEQGVDRLEANPEQLARGLAVKTILEARELAREYGMQSCSRGA
jgi:hypothetical protein